MPKEIERKFLVANDNWRKTVVRAVRLRDGLLAYSDGVKVRIRFYGERATLTIKGPRTGISRDEFEYDIPHTDAVTLVDQHCGSDLLEKTRHHVTFGGFDWTVDEYHGLLSDIILAEIELPTEDAEFPRPDWLGPEVTGMQEYRKVNMIADRRQKRPEPSGA